MEQQKNIFLSPGISLIFPVLATAWPGHMRVWENVGQAMTSFNYTTNLKYLLAFV